MNKFIKKLNCTQKQIVRASWMHQMFYICAITYGEPQLDSKGNHFWTTYCDPLSVLCCIVFEQAAVPFIALNNGKMAGCCIKIRRMDSTNLTRIVSNFLPEPLTTKVCSTPLSCLSLRKACNEANLSKQKENDEGTMRHNYIPDAA